MSVIDQDATYEEEIVTSGEVQEEEDSGDDEALLHEGRDGEFYESRQGLGGVYK